MPIEAVVTLLDGTGCTGCGFGQVRSRLGGVGSAAFAFSLFAIGDKRFLQLLDLIGGELLGLGEHGSKVCDFFIGGRKANIAVGTSAVHNGLSLAIQEDEPRDSS